MASHRTEVLTIGPQTTVGSCSCGWVGQDRRDYGLAKIDANKHKIDAMRSGNGDPRQLEIPAAGKTK